MPTKQCEFRGWDVVKRFYWTEAEQEEQRQKQKTRVLNQTQDCIVACSLRTIRLLPRPVMWRLPPLSSLRVSSSVAVKTWMSYFVLITRSRIDSQLQSTSSSHLLRLLFIFHLSTPNTSSSGTLCIFPGCFCRLLALICSVFYLSAGDIHLRAAVRPFWCSSALADHLI